MEYKIVLADPKTGKTYKLELKEEKAKILKGKNIGDEVDGTLIGLSGYKVVITGGSDKCGFPMKKGVHGIGREKVLMKEGVGYNPKESLRKRKRVHSGTITEDIVQVNAKVTEYGKKALDELIGTPAEGEGEGEVLQKEKLLLRLQKRKLLQLRIKR